MIGGEEAVGDPEIPLQLDGIARGQWHQGLQPDGTGERDVGGGALTVRPAKLDRAVPREPLRMRAEMLSAHPRLLPNHRIVAEHLRDRRALLQQGQLLCRPRLELPAGWRQTNSNSSQLGQ